MSEENQIDEKVVNQDYETADPVAPAGGDGKKKNRPADQQISVDPKADNIEDDVKTPQGTADKKSPARKADKSMKESIEMIFDGSDLSEEFKQRTVAVFEAAVHEKAVSIREELEAKFEQDLEEQVGIALNDVVEKVDAYLDYVVESWMAENEVAVETRIKVEVAESIMNGLTNLVSEHNLAIDEAEIDAVAELEAQIEEATAKYNEVFEELLEMRKERNELEIEMAFQEVVEDLTDTQADKLRVLSEGVSYETVEEFTQKLTAIRNSYFAENVTPVSSDESEVLQEEVEDEKPAYSDPSVAAYVQTLSRFAAKK